MKTALLTLVALGILGLSSCTHRGKVTMNAMRPADITLPSDIETIVLLDRTDLDQQKKLGLLEGILTGELPDEDKAAVQRALSTFNATLQTTPRFNGTIASERLSGNSVTNAFPPQLSWEEIDELCRKYNAQAVLAIELFDSDFIITNGKRKTKKTVGEGENKREIEVDEWYAKGVANMFMGMRLYDNLNNNLIDEQFYKRTNTWEQAAGSKAEAIAKLVQKSDATASLSSSIAENYAHRISPMPVRLSRMFYRKHKKAPAIEIGTRLADVNRWKDALEVWEEGIATADMKRAGFLAYNTAIAYEVMGDLDKAIKFAQDAYVLYDNKDARGYVSTLKARQRDEARLEKQQ